MTRTELEKYKGGDEFMEKLSQKLDDMNADDIWFATPEEDYQAFLENEREEGYKQGIEQGKKETIINMLIDKTPIEKIILYTGLSEEEINQIKKENFDK